METSPGTQQSLDEGSRVSLAAYMTDGCPILARLLR